MVGTSILGSWNGHWKDRSTRISSTARPTDLCANFTCCCGFSGHGVQPSSPPWWSHGGCEKTNIATENSPFIEDLNSFKKKYIYSILYYTQLLSTDSVILLYYLILIYYKYLGKWCCFQVLLALGTLYPAAPTALRKFHGGAPCVQGSA